MMTTTNPAVSIGHGDWIIDPRANLGFAAKTITFSAGSVSIEPSGSTVTGVLEIGEAIVPLQVPVEIEQRPAGCVRLTGSVDISLDSVGLRWNRLGVIGRTAKLHADLTLQQQL